MLLFGVVFHPSRGKFKSTLMGRITVHLRKTPLCVAIQLAIVSLTLSLLSAQELGTTVLNGAITDSSGAVVRNAEVRLENTATGMKRTAITNNSGLFVFNDLTPGDYIVHVKATGFAEANAQAHLEVGQQANLNIHLPVEIRRP